ncbi:uncharacterized protein [Mytilus edulis]|uniref:uncharacterized protein n=1 Tax=Mytilus edulis TaxID=6550 RepID=UPI0039F14820
MTLFISTGITLDNTVKEAVQNSGIEVGSYMYELYPNMCELLINSKSDNTVKSYFNSYKRWERFITLQGHKSLPAQPVHVALYLTHLLNNNSACHPISNAVYGIKWAHEINGLNDHTSKTFVTSILEASKRVAPKKTNKKDPITPGTLIELCDMFKNSLDLLVIRDLAIMILSFSGFLRYDEISSLRFCDVKNKKLSYTAARESILKRIRIICPEGNIGLHSFRSGGATMAANADVSDRCLKKHGRWKSDSSKDGYIVDSTEKRLKISKVLGL